MPLPLSRTAFATLALLLLAPAEAGAQILGTPQPIDRFGAALAAGDYNGDGHGDLAVGAYRDQASGVADAGAVNVIYGTADGLGEQGNQLWHQNSPDIEGGAEQNDFFGTALAAGDFNGDGYHDLAVGVPWEGAGGASQAGAINVIYGSPAGLAAEGDQVWIHNDFPGQTSEEDDHFGDALATGDFDGDGFADLAIGIPDEDVGATLGGGAVQIAYGSAAGLAATGTQTWTQTSAGAGTTEDADFFGDTLASHDFDGDGFADLAVGVPYETVDGQDEAGGVVVLYGTGSGLSATGSQLWSQGSPDVPGVPEPTDNFGRGLGAGDFNGDGFGDLAAGVYREDEGVESSGAVNVLYGSASGLTGTGSQIWTQESAGVPGVSEQNDVFGLDLARGDFDGDGFGDLAIGALGENERAGAVTVLYGSAAGLTGTGSQQWLQGAGGLLGESEPDDNFSSSLAAVDIDGDGRDDLAVGAEGQVVSGAGQAGAVSAIYGAAGGLTADGNQYVHQGASLPVASEPGIPEPTALALQAPYPNPAAGPTTLGFTLPEAGPVRLTVFDVLGREVARLVDGVRPAGPHEVAFDAGALPGGTYLVRLEAGGGVQTRRVTRVR